MKLLRTLTFSSFTLFSIAVFAQNTCKVVDPELASGLYQGACSSSGLASGYGRIQSQDGKSSYEGDFLDGKKNGQGRKAFSNGDVYQGQWQSDQRSGIGTYIYGVLSPWFGDRYEGQWLSDRMHGIGTYSWAMGDVYAGRWLNNLQVDGVTSGQARRAAYLKTFIQTLPKTKNQVCPRPTSVYFSAAQRSVGLRPVPPGLHSLADKNMVQQRSLLRAYVTSTLGDRVYLVFSPEQRPPVLQSGTNTVTRVQEKPTLDSVAPHEALQPVPQPIWQLVSDWYPCEKTW